jgi:hypothetical protein
MNTKFTGVLLVLILIVGIVGLVGIFQDETLPLGMAGYNDLGYSGVTNSSTSISIAVAALSTSTANEVLAANSARQYARIQNTGVSLITLQLNSATSTLKLNEGIVLATSGEASIYTIGPDNLYIGRVMGLAAIATGTISKVEK